MAKGTVLVHLSRPPRFLEGHEGVVLLDVARAIARLKACDFGGCYDVARPSAAETFFVPDDTLARRVAAALGVRHADDVFGGVVDPPFVATKVITHELVAGDAARPEGWRAAFGARVRSVALPGYSVFGADDAREATRRLLRTGGTRAKLPRSAGSRGQRTLTCLSDVDGLLDVVGADDLARHGLVLEANLVPVTTLSVGVVRVGDDALAYHGRQRTTRDNAGRDVYGGSDLVCVRGGWEALEALPLDAPMRTAVVQAHAYDDATAEYGVVASRRNYDVAQGMDGAGRWRSGVLEASWRVGGASAAEVAALEAFAADPALAVLHVSTVESYGTDVATPREATVHFRGVDPEAGPLTRYTVISGAERAA